MKKRKMDGSKLNFQVFLHKGRQLHRKNLLKQAEESKMQALEMCLQLHGKETNHKDTAECYQSVGLTLCKLGKFKEAEEFERRALEMKLKVYENATNNADVAWSYQSLGATLHSLRRHKEAEECKRKALNMFLQIWETNDNIHVANSYFSLGLTLHSLMVFREAEICKRKALDMQLKVYGSESINTEIANSYLNLGITLISLSRYKDAEECMRKGLNIFLQVYTTTDNTDVANSYRSLGATLHLLSRYEEAEEYERKALEIRIKIFGNTTFNTEIAVSYLNLGLTLHSLSRYKDAEECGRKALDIFLEAYGTDDNAHVAESFYSLGTTLHDLSRYEEAEKFKRKALVMQIKLHGDRTCNTDIAKSYFNLGKTLYSLNRHTEAEECERKALEMSTALCDHDEIANRIRSLPLSRKVHRQVSAQECDERMSSMQIAGAEGEVDDEFSEGEEIFCTEDIEKRIINLCFKPCDVKSLYRSQKVYLMSKVTRGRCLIINNKTFHKCDRLQDERLGSDVDVKNLENLFTMLWFKVIVKNDLESNRLTEEIRSEIGNQDHMKYGMFVLVIMTHGDYGVLYGTDNQPVKRHDVLQVLYESKLLKGKPKLVIIQACAGDCKTRYEYDIKASSSSLCSRISDAPDDVVLLTSAFDGFLSERKAGFGCPFIRALTEAIYKHAHHWDIEKIFKQVAHKMRVTSHARPAMNSFLSKKLYLFPNYDGE